MLLLIVIWVRSVSEEYVPTGVDEFIKLAKFIYKADPVTSLAMSGIKLSLIHI